MSDDRTEVRNSLQEKRRWLAAATLHGKDLSEWIRDSLNDRAADDLSQEK
jgi:hypothetical protein